MIRKRAWIALIAVLGLVAAACGGDDSSDTTAGTDGSGSVTTTTTATTGDVSQWGLPIIDPFDIPSGDIGIAGSSTVFPLSTALVSKLIDEGGPEYAIQSVGSGGGFERFCVSGESDISNASRPIKDSERESCAAIGRDPIEIRVGTDALSVVISSTNYFAQELTLAEIATAFSAPAGATWDSVNPSFPTHPIKTFSPGADSGTFDYFNEVVFDEADPPPILVSGVAEIVGEDDNITVKGVSEDGCTEGDLSSTCAIGYFGFAFFQNSADILQAVAVDGVSPGIESVNADTYPISRPLFMYTDAGIVAEKPQVAQFIAYYLNNVNEVIGEVGYFPAPDEKLQEAADAIAAAAGF
ncbi:MAG: substrate-binding domain-containing protein [Acidimicrobiia bacterium]|nr:substrate-binding domain-containing protein [Acidimicrobiia bacterium]NNF89259.1 phosphate-binding protein [Acidimicrobiia bacterium]